MHDLVDTDRYPVDRLDSAEGAELVASCAAELWDRSALTLPGFLRQEIVVFFLLWQVIRTANFFLNIFAHVTFVKFSIINRGYH